MNAERTYLVKVISNLQATTSTLKYSGLKVELDIMPKPALDLIREVCAEEACQVVYDDELGFDSYPKWQMTKESLLDSGPDGLRELISLLWQDDVDTFLEDLLDIITEDALLL